MPTIDNSITGGWYYSNSTAAAGSYSWSNATTAVGGAGNVVIYFPTIYFASNEANPETNAEKIARFEKNKKKERERIMAEETAQKLMEEILGAEKLQEYIASRKVSVDSPSIPGRRYEIDARNRIKVYEAGTLVDELCIHLTTSVDGQNRRDLWLPDADVVLGKAFLVLNNEERLLQVANHSRRV